MSAIHTLLMKPYPLNLGDTGFQNPCCLLSLTFFARYRQRARICYQGGQCPFGLGVVTPSGYQTDGASCTSYINQMKGNRCVWWQLRFLLATHFLVIPELCAAAQGCVTRGTVGGGGHYEFPFQAPCSGLRSPPSSSAPFPTQWSGAAAGMGSCLQVFSFLPLR